MKRLHAQHQYTMWAKTLVDAHITTVGSKVRRFLKHLFDTGQISQDERRTWEPILINDIKRLTGED